MFEMKSPLIYEPMTVGDASLVFTEKVNNFTLFINGESWMGYNTESHWQAKEFYLEVQMAKGVCITTGLGLGVLQTNLCLKDSVTKVIAYEQSPDVIAMFHKIVEKNNFDISKLEIRHADANFLTGEQCDYLFVDHFEKEPENDILNVVRKLSESNTASVIWYWPATLHFLKFVSKNKLEINEDAYLLWKEFTKISNLPESVNDTTIQYFCDMQEDTYEPRLSYFNEILNKRESLLSLGKKY